MSRSFPGRFALTGLLLLAPLCLPLIARADDESDWLAAFEQGNSLRQKGDFPAAAKQYEWALRQAPQLFGPDHQNTLAVLNNLGMLYYDMGQYSKAEPLDQRCLKLREAKLGPSHLDVATSLNNLAVLYVDTSQYAKAEPLYQRCLKIQESQLGPNHQDVAATLNNLATLYQCQGQYAKAEPLHRRSLKIRESQLGPDHAEVGTSLNNLAKLYTDMGQYAKAEPLYQRCLAIWETQLGPDHPDVALCLNNLADLYQLMGQYAKAIPMFQRCLKVREAKLGPNHPDVAVSLIGLANVYRILHQYAQAEPLFQRSLKIQQSNFGPNHPHVAWSLICLANLYKAQGQYAKAEPLFQQSIKIMESKFGPDHPDVATYVVELGMLYSAMRQFDKADPLLKRGIRIKESTVGADHPGVIFDLNELVSLNCLFDHFTESVVLVDKQRRIVRRHVARTLPILSEREQLTFLQQNDEVYFHNALSLGLHQRADAQAVERSAGWILNGKAVAQEVLAQRTLLAAQGTDPALADLVKQLLAVRSQLASLSMSAARPGEEAGHRQKLQELNRQEQELSRRLGQASGRNDNMDPWVELDTVRKALAKDAVLIDVARFRVANFKAVEEENPWLPPRYAAWLIPAAGQGEVSIVDLGEAEKIDAAVQAARKVLEKAGATIGTEGEAKAEKQLREPMKDLARLVLEPLIGHLDKARELVVSPDAALWLVPWGALPLADGKYAIEKYQIRYCISGRDLVQPPAAMSQKATNPVLFANPDYDLGPREAQARTVAVLRTAAPLDQVASSRGLGSLSRLPRVRRLPGTAEEAAAIKPSVTHYAKAEAVVYEDQYALESVVKALHSPQVLVLSTHGFFMPDQEAAWRNSSGLTTENKPLENPLLRCGLLLAGCNQRAEEGIDVGGDDGILTGLEIVGTDLRATDLVVLSACETGLGQVRNGEGVAGLRQAFQLAGARAVVSTLWQIPDEESVDVMNAFFAYLAQGQTKAASLRNAQLALIKARRADHSAAHPYYWAAYTLTGE